MMRDNDADEFDQFAIEQQAVRQFPNENVFRRNKPNLLKRSYSRAFGALVRLAERTKRQREFTITMFVIGLIWLTLNLVGTLGDVWARGTVTYNSNERKLIMGLFSLRVYVCETILNNSCVYILIYFTEYCVNNCKDNKIHYSYGIFSIACGSITMCGLSLILLLHILITRKRLKGRQKLAIQLSVIAGLILNVITIVLYAMLVYKPLSRGTNVVEIGEISDLKLDKFGYSWYTTVIAILFIFPQIVLLLFIKI